MKGSGWDRKSIRTIAIVAGVALTVWGIFNLYPALQPPSTQEFREYPEDKLWTYGAGLMEGSLVSYEVYHVSLKRNVTVTYTVIDTDREDDRWRVSVHATDGLVAEDAFVLTQKNILPTSGSEFIDELERFEVATRMPVAEFLVGLEDQPLVVGAQWQMAFLAPDNTYTRAYIADRESIDGQEVFVLKYGPERSPSFAWFRNDYPVPLKDEYTESLTDEVISVHRLIEFRR